MVHRLLAAKCLLIGLLGTTLGSGSLPVQAGEAETEWKAGAASVVITPEQPMWMAGYASRDKPSEGKVHDLTAKALAIQDSQGARLVIVTLDLISISRDTRDWLQKQVAQKYQLPPQALLVNASHTHIVVPKSGRTRSTCPRNAPISAASTWSNCKAIC